MCWVSIAELSLPAVWIRELRRRAGYEMCRGALMDVGSNENLET